MLKGGGEAAGSADEPEGYGIENIEPILLEYGRKYSSSAIYMLHLDEYGELVVSNPAVEKLAAVYS